nr:hypothetical protein [uncultured Draconibacterium sp.]
MPIDITEKSEELKEFISQFDTTMFLGDISSLMPYIKFGNPMQTLNGLSSPQRQLLYLAGLNITSKQPDQDKLKDHFTDDEFEHIKKLLNEIENGYVEFFYPKPDDIIDEDWKTKRMAAMPTFLSYFNQGLLNYEEQIIERISEYFTPFNTEIQNHFGLNVIEFIDIYNFIDKIPNEFLEEKINPKEGQQSWEEFGAEMESKGIMPWDWQKHMPQHFEDLFSWMYDKGKMQRFTRKSLIDKFGEAKADSFIQALTCERQKTNFLYYTEKNPIYQNPIFKISDDEFQAIEMNHIIQAIYNNLFEFCISQNDLREKIYAVRGKKMEEKIVKVFQRFFKSKAFVYNGFYTQDAHEQDLLFLYKGLALIVEAKASKRDEPRREPDKAYPLILSNFDETIQKGYDQTYRVKSKFIDKKVLKIYKDQGLKKHLIDIRTKNYANAFSLIVTLERFGQIQTDLSILLEIYEDDEFPLSICIDDLETFLLLMEKKGKKPSDLTQFLLMRQKLHERLLTADELEVCGAFLNGKIDMKQVNDDETVFALTPDLADIFDNAYQKGGLGFTNEKNMDIKTSDKHLPIGGF